MFDTTIKTLKESVDAITGLAVVVAGVLKLLLSQTDADRYSIPIAVVFFLTVFALQIVNQVRARPTAPSAPKPADGDNVFGLRDLQPFDIGDPLWGREDDVRRIRGVIRDEEFRCGLVLGEAGSGRTSLLRAGLLTYLQDDPNFRWMYVRTQSKPLAEQLANTPVRPAPVPAWQGTDLRELAEAARAENRRLLVIFDDFDTLWTQPSASASAADQLQWLKPYVEESNLAVSFLFVVREDLLQTVHDLEQALGVVPAKYRFDVRRFETGVARSVLTRLVQRDEAQLEPGLIERIVHDLTFHDGVCPAELQIVGTWLKERRVLSVPKYDRVGSATGVLSAVIREKLVASTDETVARIVLARLAGQALSSEKSGCGLQLADFGQNPPLDPGEVQHVLDLLVADRLVVPAANGGYRLVHEYFGSIVRDALRDHLPLREVVRRRLVSDYEAGARPIQALCCLALVGLIAYAGLVFRTPVLDGQKLGTLSPDIDGWTSNLVAFDPKGQSLAVFGTNPTRTHGITIWQLPSFSQSRYIDLPDIPPGFIPYQFAFDRTGQVISVYGYDGKYGSWSVGTGALTRSSWDSLIPLASVPDCSASTRAVALNENRDLLAVGFDCGPILVFDLQTGTRQNAFQLLDSDCGPSYLAFGQGSQGLFAGYPCGGADGGSRGFWWSLLPGQSKPAPADNPLAAQNLKGTVFGADGNPRGVLQSNARTLLVDLIAGSRLGSWPLASDWEDSSGGLSPDGALLAVDRGAFGVDVYSQPMLASFPFSANTARIALMPRLR
jgi:Novel STAND NTPase 1